MTSDASKLPEPVLKVDARGAPPPGDRLAADLRGFGPLGILAILVIVLAGIVPFVPLSAILVLVWARWSRTPWREIGYVRPKSWTRDLAVGIAFGIAFKFLMKAMVMPLLGAPPITQAFHYLAGNRPRSQEPCTSWLSVRPSEKRPYSGGTSSNALASCSDPACGPRH
jgi:hypothetical protein